MGKSRQNKGAWLAAKAASAPRPAHTRPDVPAPAAAPGPCPHARACGACSQLEVPYARQLEGKERAIHALFDELAGPECSFEPILGMDDPFAYRDKIASPFAPGRRLGAKAAKCVSRARRDARPADRREVLCGMYAAGTHRIVPIDACPVEHPAGRAVVRAVKRLMERYGMQPYDEDAGTGFVRHVVVRVGHETGEVLATIVTNGRDFPASRNFCRELVKACPQVTTVVQNVNTHATNAILGQEERVLYGPGFILDMLCGLSFRISSHSFYQVNARQTEVLYRAAVAMAVPAGNAPESGVAGVEFPGEGFAETGFPARLFTLVDAYCGTGTIGLVAASLVPGARVVGVDNVESAIRDARQNAAHNGVGNAEFAAEDAGAFLRRMAAEGKALDVLMMDPPRAGSTSEFLQAALALRPQRIVYISCNPTTQARDARMLLEGGYRLRRIQPVDMFPHTAHIECVALFQ